jgi:Mat/Ecp fimbriae major subunit
MKFATLKAAFVGTVFAAAAFGSTAAQAATADADAKATILAALSVTKTSDLNFGTIAVNGGGSVVVTNAGVRAATTGGTVSSAATGAAASFNIVGASGSNILISVPASAILQYNDGTTIHSMSASLTTNASTSAHALTGGAETFGVGGTLTVAPAQTAGAYVGAFTVTVQYQ